MPKRPEVRVDADRIDAARDKLAALAEAGPSTLSLRAAVSELYPQIKAALQRGHSYDAIATAITTDVPLKAATLAAYLRDIERNPPPTAPTAAPPSTPTAPTPTDAKPIRPRKTKKSPPAAPTEPPAQSRHAGFDEDV